MAVMVLVVMVQTLAVRLVLINALMVCGDGIDDNTGMVMLVVVMTAVMILQYLMMMLVVIIIVVMVSVMIFR